MAEDALYYPFSSGPGASIDENKWADMALDWSAPSGVRLDETQENIDDSLLVVQTGTASFQVSPGVAKVRGFHYRLNSPVNYNVDPNSVDNVERKDLVSLTLDMTGSPTVISTTVRKGAEAPIGKSVAPNPFARWGGNTPGIYDLSLAVIVVQGTTTAPSIVQINDVRSFLDYGIYPVASAGVYPNYRFDGQVTFDRVNRRFETYQAGTGKNETLVELGPFRSYSPTVVGFTIKSDAKKFGRYKVIGGTLCHVSIFFKLGNQSLSGKDIQLTLPFKAGGDHTQIMPLFWQDNSSSTNKRVGIAEIDPGSSITNRLQLTGESAADLNTVQSLGTYDELYISGSYEVSP